MKNHIIVDNNLVKTNKKWSDLKEKQKEMIYSLFKENHIEFYNIEKRIPNKLEKEQILDNVYEVITEKNIWIPFYEVKRFYISKINKLNKLI